MATLVERFAECVSDWEKFTGQKFNAADMARKCGVKRATVANWKNGVAKSISGAPLIAAAEYFNVSPGWLNGGSVPKNKGISTERKPSDDLSEIEGNNFHQQRFIPKMVPRISTVSAGPWTEIADNHPPGFGEDIDFCPVPCSDGTVSFVVSGDSMTSPYGPDTFPHGTTIFVDPNVLPENGSFVIAKVNGEAEVTFKQFVVDGPRRFLRPLNSIYPLISDEFRVLGVVVASQRLHR